MHRYLTEHFSSCPFCAETISILIDASHGSQTYIEDCQVCCRPIEVKLTVQENGTLCIELDCAN
jgi:hypothetical protein